MLLAFAYASASASVLLVDTLGEPAGLASANCVPGACTLRDAINSASAGDTIRFAAALDGQTILVSLYSNDVSTGSKEFGPSAFFVTNGASLTIDGLTGLAHGVTIARDPHNSPAFRFFDVGSGSTLHLSGLVLANGQAHGGNAGYGGGALGAGGAIFNQGTVTIDRCTFTGNIAAGGDIGSFVSSGGGVGEDAGTESAGQGGGPNPGLFSGNAGGFGGGGGAGADNFSGPSGAGGRGGFGGGGGEGGADQGFGPGTSGGGGFGGGGGTDNFGDGSGAGLGGFGAGNGAIYYGGGAGAGMGGAIFNDAGIVTITNSTFGGNTARGGGVQVGAGGNGAVGFGGAIFNLSGSLTIAFTTLAQNTVAAGSLATGTPDGGAIFSLGDGACAAGGNICPLTSASLIMDDSIAGYSTGSSNDVVVATINGGSSTASTASGNANNLIGTQSGFASGVLSAGDPRLTTHLAANQGFGLTYYPLLGSPAVDAVPCRGLTLDERGQPRPQGTACDVGAVEALPASQTTLTVTGLGEPATIGSANCTAAQCPTLRDALNSALPGATIHFAPALDGQTIALTLFSNDVSASSIEFGPSSFFVTNGMVVTIDGTSGLVHGVTIARATGALEFRLFDVDHDSSLTLQGLTLSNGVARGGGSDIGGAAMGAGGAIFNQGHLTIARCTLDGNSAFGGSIVSSASSTNGGGGVGGAASGRLGGGPNGGATSGFSGTAGGFGGGGGGGGSNPAPAGLGGPPGPGGFGGGAGASGFGGSGGGAIGSGNPGGFGGGGNGSYNAATGGSAGGFGGGAGSGSANTGGGAGGGMGGALFNDAGVLTVIDSTFTANLAAGGNNAFAASGNGSGYGGAIFNYAGNASLSFVTIAGNSVRHGTGGLGGAVDGSAVYSLGDDQCAAGGNTCGTGDAQLVVADSIVYGGIGGNDLSAGTLHGGTGAVTFQGANIVASTSVTGSATTTGPSPLTSNPLLGSLADNSGSNFTLLPATGSPAINAAPDCQAAGGGAVAVDERGLPRPSGPACDLGAVEVQPFLQTIDFPNPGPFTYAPNGTFQLSATASSNLPVSFSSITPSVCSVSGATVTILSAGTCSIVANQPGNVTYAPSSQQDDIAIDKAAQTLAITSTAPDPAVGGIYHVVVTAGGSTSPVIFSTTGVCTNGGAVVTFTGAGTCTVTANQAGDGNYTAAAAVQQQVSIGAAVCTVDSTADDPAEAAAKVTSVDALNWSGAHSTIYTLRDCILAADLMTAASGQPTDAAGRPTAQAQSVPALTIRFAAALSGATIVLAGELPLIFNNVSIDASALPNPVHIDGGRAHRIFFVSGLPTLDPLQYVNGVPNPDGAQPILVSFAHLALQNGLARGGCSGTGGGGMGAGGALFVNHFATVQATDVLFASNTAQGGDSSTEGSVGGTAGGGMRSRAVGGAGGGLGDTGDGDGADCTLAPAGDTVDGRGIGASGSGTAGGGFGGPGLGQVSLAQNFSGPFGGGAQLSSGAGDPGGIGGGGHFGSPAPG
ncbi:MAG TPA: choice-of-anchor Q domain-containing protein, partial [Rudaea sp.]|nr:choice-of-anchor Q domain-containing protein [Rudaea sp.]